MGAQASKPPLVSVLLLCYNQARYLPTSIGSVAEQGIATQLIVLDDASSDGSDEAAQALLSRYPGEATLLLHDTNHGVSRSLNEALEYARAPFVAALAADDYWLPGKLSRQVAVLQGLPPTFGVVYSDAELCDDAGAPIPGRFIGHRTRHLSDPRPSGWIFRDLLQGNFIPAPSTLIRRSCFSVVGGFDETLLLEDFEFWLRLSRRYQFHYDDVVRTVYRVHGQSAVHTRYLPLRRDLMRTYERHITPRTAGAAAAYVSYLAFDLYMEGEPNGLSLVWRSLRYRLNLRALAMLVPAAMGVRGRRARAVRRGYKLAKTSLGRIRALRTEDRR